MLNWGALAWGAVIMAIALAARYNMRIAPPQRGEPLHGGFMRPPSRFDARSTPSQYGFMPLWRSVLARAGGAGLLTGVLRATTVGLALLVQLVAQIVLGHGIGATLSASGTLLAIGILIGVSLGALEGVVLSLWHTPLPMSPRRSFATILAISAGIFIVLFLPLPIWLPSGSITGLKLVVTGIVPAVAGALGYGVVAAFLIVPGAFARSGASPQRLSQRQRAWRVFWLGTLPPATATLLAAMAFALINGGLVLAIGAALALIVFFAAIFAVPSFFLADWLIGRWNASAVASAPPLPHQPIPSGSRGSMR
jgi:hypothetical protein